MQRHDDPKFYIGRERTRTGYRWRVTIIEEGIRSRSSFASESDARASLEAVKRDTREQRRLTVTDLIEMWCEDLAGRCTPESVRIQRRLALGLCDAGLDLPIAQVTPQQGKAWYGDYQSGRAAATHQQALQVTRACWRWGLEEGLVKANPFRRVSRAGKRRRRKVQLRVNEGRKLLALARDELSPNSHRHAFTRRRGSLAALISLLMGLRNGEVRAIEVRDIDDDGKLLWVADGKTDSAVRTLQIPEPLRLPLLEFVKGKPATELVFPMGHSWFEYQVTRLCRAAGIPRVTPHGLRGTQASISTEAGATPHDVAATLGHADTRVTEAHYIDPSTAQQARADKAWRVLKGGG